MDLDEEFNIFDDCDELFDINDTELCTDDKVNNDLVLLILFLHL